MKKKLFLLSLSMIAASYLFAQSNPITGHWTGILMNQYNITYDFVAQGDSLTGKDTHSDGTVSEISNGKVLGDSISYTVPIQGQATPITGKLKEGVLTLYFSVQGYDLSVDLKKSEGDKKE